MWVEIGLRNTNQIIVKAIETKNAIEHGSCCLCWWLSSLIKIFSSQAEIFALKFYTFSHVRRLPTSLCNSLLEVIAMGNQMKPIETTYRMTDWTVCTWSENILWLCTHSTQQKYETKVLSLIDILLRKWLGLGFISLLFYESVAWFLFLHIFVFMLSTPSCCSPQDDLN